MNFLLDTCVVSEATKISPAASVGAWLREYAVDYLYLSALTIGEIQKGITRLDEGKKRQNLQHWLDTDLRPRFVEHILPVDEEVAVAWGLLDADMQKAGTPIPILDGLIGATAIVHNLAIATRNELHFHRIGVRVFNPWN